MSHIKINAPLPKAKGPLLAGQFSLRVENLQYIKRERRYRYKRLNEVDDMVSSKIVFEVRFFKFQGRGES